MSQIDPEKEIVFLADLEKKMIGCVLLQAAFGGNSSIVHQVNTDKWFLAPTDNMKLYRIPRDKESIDKVVNFFNN